MIDNKLIPKVIRNTGWESILLPLFSDEWIPLREGLITHKNSISPHPSKIFNAFSFFEPKDLKCIFIGKSPYHGIRNKKRIATGIPFANDIESHKGEIASSTLDVFVQSIDKYDITLGYKKDNPFDFSLKSICKQGVLFINVNWTIGLDGSSHKEQWFKFTELMLQIFNKEFNAIPYVFCGKEAQDFIPLINENNNHIIRVCHPDDTVTLHKEKGTITKVPKHLNFVYQNPFKQVNDYLFTINGIKDSILWR